MDEGVAYEDYQTSGRDPSRITGEWYGLAYVVGSRKPGAYPVDAQPEATVGNSAVPPYVDVELVGVPWVPSSSILSRTSDSDHVLSPPPMISP